MPTSSLILAYGHVNRLSEIHNAAGIWFRPQMSQHIVGEGKQNSAALQSEPAPSARAWCRVLRSGQLPEYEALPYGVSYKACQKLLKLPASVFRPSSAFATEWERDTLACQRQQQAHGHPTLMHEARKCEPQANCNRSRSLMRFCRQNRSCTPAPIRVSGSTASTCSPRSVAVRPRGSANSSPAP